MVNILDIVKEDDILELIQDFQKLLKNLGVFKKISSVWTTEFFKHSISVPI